MIAVKMICIHLGTMSHVGVVEEKVIHHTDNQEEDYVQHGTNYAIYATKEDISRGFPKQLIKNKWRNLKHWKRKLTMK